MHPAKWVLKAGLDEFEMLSLINSRRDGALNARCWQRFAESAGNGRPISLQSMRELAIYQRFAFLTAITGVTSFVLFGMTVMANDKMNLNLQLHYDRKDINSVVDIGLRLLAFVLSFVTAILVRFQMKRKLYDSWLYGLLALLLSTALCVAVLINFFRTLDNGRITWRNNGDFSMVYLSCLFILSLFNGLSSFVYCQFIRDIDITWREGRRTAQPSNEDDLPPSYEECIQNPKIFV